VKRYTVHRHNSAPVHYVKSGEFRPPRRGEWYLSGAIPQAWQAPNNFKTAYSILRPGTDAEVRCAHCNQLLPE
jgi:hypothetical protein